MLAAPAPDGSEQNTAAGAEVALLTVPTALIILALLWLGAGLGVLSRRSHDRLPSRIEIADRESTAGSPGEASPRRSVPDLVGEPADELELGLLLLGRHRVSGRY